MLRGERAQYSLKYLLGITLIFGVFFNAAPVQAQNDTGIFTVSKSPEVTDSVSQIKKTSTQNDTGIFTVSKPTESIDPVPEKPGNLRAER